MIRLKEIQDAMLHLVGWEQSYDPEREIDKTFVESESGLLFQQAHPLMTLDNIENTIPENFMLQYPEWNQIKTYAQGTKVRHNGIVWIANYDSTGIEPEATDFNQDFNNDFGSELAGAWVKYNFLSDYLERLTRSGIAKAIQTFIQTKQLNRETRDLFDRKTFFDGAARLQATIRASHKLVGIELVPVRAMGVTLKIHKIGFQAVGATGIVKFYLFHSSQKDPVKTFEVNFTNTSGGFQWFSFEDLFLPYISDGTDAGGAWFLCYYQDELPFGMEALNVSKDWSREPCGTCNIGSVEIWREMTKYLQASPFCVIPPEDFSENPQMWDIAQTMYTNTMNYGINCEISIGCDLTDFIIEQRAIFANVVQRQVAVDTLRMMAMNPSVRVNRNQSNVSRMDILYELDGNSQSSRPQGLGYDLKKAYDALTLETKGLDRICLKCQNGGVKYRTA